MNLVYSTSLACLVILVVGCSGGAGEPNEQSSGTKTDQSIVVPTDHVCLEVEQGSHDYESKLLLYMNGTKREIIIPEATKAVGDPVAIVGASGSRLFMVPYIYGSGTGYQEHRWVAVSYDKDTIRVHRMGLCYYVESSLHLQHGRSVEFAVLPNTLSVGKAGTMWFVFSDDKQDDRSLVGVLRHEYREGEVVLTVGNRESQQALEVISRTACDPVRVWAKKVLESSDIRNEVGRNGRSE